jgi:hypothetical protein
MRGRAGMGRKRCKHLACGGIFVRYAFLDGKRASSHDTLALAASSLEKDKLALFGRVGPRWKSQSFCQRFFVIKKETIYF